VFLHLLTVVCFQSLMQQSWLLMTASPSNPGFPSTGSNLSTTAALYPMLSFASQSSSPGTSLRTLPLSTASIVRSIAFRSTQTRSSASIV